MAEEKKVNYSLVILLSTLSSLLPALGAVFLAFVLFLDGKNKISIGLTPEAIEVSAYVIFVVTFLQWIILRTPLKKLYLRAVQQREYDEFGMSKKASYDNLTRKEREELDKQKAAQMESLLSTSVLNKVTKKGSENPDEDLASLIGIISVKEKTKEMVARMKFEHDTKKTRKKQESGTNAMGGRHMCFYGNPGTGKTTIARIITGFLHKYGYIKENKCIEIDGNFLKAGSESAMKTRLIIQKAYGGVLFIDEAYTIIDGSHGDEIIATLIKEMEDNRDKLIVIVAGYKGAMKRLLDSNEGFKSRIKEYLEFPDYNAKEMEEIFTAMAHSEGYVVTSEALQKFSVRCEKEKLLNSFGNARTARNILDETIDKHALNYGTGRLFEEKTVNGMNIEDDDKKKLQFMLCGCDVNTNTNKAVL